MHTIDLELRIICESCMAESLVGLTMPPGEMFRCPVCGRVEPLDVERLHSDAARLYAFAKNLSERCLV